MAQIEVSIRSTDPAVDADDLKDFLGEHEEMRIEAVGDNDLDGSGLIASEEHPCMIGITVETEQTVDQLREKFSRMFEDNPRLNVMGVSNP